MFFKRLKELRVSRNMTQSQLADLLGVAKSTVSMYENGRREPDLETLEAIADIFNVDLNSLASSKDANIFLKIPNIMPLPDAKVIPLLGDIACGEPILATENIADYVKIDMSIDADFALRCKGDSMINARIFDGDIVYIRQQSDVDDGDIAAVLIGEEATLKKVYKTESKIVLRPCNPMYEDIVYLCDELNDIRILGKAIMFTSLVRHGK
ncbi:MAG: helix-turn-helix domain-containing protein [Clostridia bacterium]|nr:helix-turn-helix domain-containing protein [Clostridia bacterium]